MARKPIKEQMEEALLDIRYRGRRHADRCAEDRASYDNEASKQTESSRIKRTGIGVTVIVVALVAVWAVAFFAPQFSGSSTHGTGTGAFVVSERRIICEDGEYFYTYSLGEHGDVLQTDYIAPDGHSDTFQYRYDRFGNVISGETVQGSYKRHIDSADKHGQPTHITWTGHDGDTLTTRIDWYGEGRVQRVLKAGPNPWNMSARYFNESGEETLRESVQFGKSESVIQRSEFEYDRDSQERVISMIETSEEGSTITWYQYDDDGNVIRVMQDGKTIVELRYVYIEDASPAVVADSNLFTGWRTF